MYTIYMTIYINNTLPPALAVHEIYRDNFGPPMEKLSNYESDKNYRSKSNISTVGNSFKTC